MDLPAHCAISIALEESNDDSIVSEIRNLHQVMPIAPLSKIKLRHRMVVLVNNDWRNHSHLGIRFEPDQLEDRAGSVCALFSNQFLI